jgi:hypothetical protein
LPKPKIRYIILSMDYWRMKPIWIFAIAILIVGMIAVIAGVLFYGLWVSAPPVLVQGPAVVPPYVPPVQTPVTPAPNETEVPPPVEPPPFVETHPTTPRAMLEYFLFTKMIDENGAMRNIYSTGDTMCLQKQPGR